jgi:hypothetical protein
MTNMAALLLDRDEAALSLEFGLDDVQWACDYSRGNAPDTTGRGMKLAVRRPQSPSLERGQLDIVGHG